jgi:glutathione S-transferase
MHAASAEMHAGFADLREQMSMNIQRQAFGQELTAGALANVKRIEVIWRNCLSTHGGPFLFGNEFGIADAMFAPVVMRFNSYAPKLSETARAYCASVTVLPVVAEWIEGARKER